MLYKVDNLIGRIFHNFELAIVSSLPGAMASPENSSLQEQLISLWKFLTWDTLNAFPEAISLTNIGLPQPQWTVLTSTSIKLSI